MAKTITIQGHRIQDIQSFYEEINRLFMADEDWKLGNSLDALDDLLYGGYGVIDGSEPVELVWIGFEQNREDLGAELTRAHYLEKLDHPSTYNVHWVKSKLDEMDRGEGQTYFEIILEIISGHKNIKLVPR